jgi:hypothetical protein
MNINRNFVFVFHKPLVLVNTFCTIEHNYNLHKQLAVVLTAITISHEWRDAGEGSSMLQFAELLLSDGPQRPEEL